VADPDVQITGGGRRGPVTQKGWTWAQKKIFRPFGPQFGLNIRGGGGGPWAPSLSSVHLYVCLSVFLSVCLSVAPCLSACASWPAFCVVYFVYSSSLPVWLSAFEPSCPTLLSICLHWRRVLLAFFNQSPVIQCTTEKFEI